jgi:glutathione synthase/RimK-type ligase-like ATP-grasp enzyme
MLLILTSDRDLTADFLISELIDRRLPYFRINAEELAQSDATFCIDGNKVERRITIGKKSVDLSDVRAIWYRRVVQPIPVTTLKPSERAFVAGELRHLAMALVLNPQAVWVNPIDKVAIAEHKLYQLRVARNLGFRIPRTLVSSDLGELRSFCDSNSHGTICKPIFHGLFVDGATRYAIYTRRITSDLLDADSISACPILIQEEIPRKADVRVTIIGTKCFVADITGDAGLVDWREPNVSAKYIPSDIDETTRAACQGMLDELGLLYGAFDFIRTPEGDLVFLEINPTGEWAWLEDRLGFPMRDAFIELFFGSRR